MRTQTFTPPTWVEHDGGRTKFSAIQNHFKLEFPLQYEFRNRSAGALVLGKAGKNKGTVAATRTAFKFVFGFTSKGVHTTLREDQHDPVFDGIEAGLKDLPHGETMTIHLSSFSSDRTRQQQLSEIFQHAHPPQLKFLLYGEKQRIQELKESGVRKPKQLKIYCTHTVDLAAAEYTDKTERYLKLLLDWWNKFSGTEEQIQQERFELLFTKAFTDGFQFWEQLLTNKFGLDVAPMSAQELWEETWFRFNDSPAPALPQLVRFSESGITEDIQTEAHAITLLIAKQKNCPYPSRDWVAVKGQYVGALTFDAKPVGWKDKNSQLRYIWEILSREQVRDTEVFCEIAKADENLIRTDMQRLTKQSIVDAKFSSERNSVDVGAEIKRKKAIAAQEQLYEGAAPVHVACVLLVHRPSPQELDEACRYIQSMIRRPAVLDREQEYTWQTWLQTLPIVWDALLATPFNRRLRYLSSEAPGFLSLVNPRPCDHSGFELISDEGGVPLFLDMFKRHRNLGIFATTRGGKSVLVSGILTQALAQNIPVVALDFPKPDGSSTFTDYTRFLGKNGAYFDISKEANNLFEIPDLRGLNLEQQQERMQDYIGFLESALLLMVLGKDGGSADNKSTVRSLLIILLDQFFADPVIWGRYQTAIEEGFGSKRWATMPTLQDFLGFCDLNRIEVIKDEITDEMRLAMGKIKLQLQTWITSRVGRSISAVSSFPTDAPLLVFALRNLSDEMDAAIMALSAYSAALRRALQHPASIVFFDESPILFEFEEISALVGRLCANGAKAGIEVIISAQDPDTIAKSGSASKILQNLTTRLVGRIQQTAVQSFVRYLDYPSEIIARNASESFFPKRDGIYSQWLLDDSGVFTYCRYYPSLLQLAVVANNPDEQMARTAYMKAYGDKYKGLSAFAEELAASLRGNRPLQAPNTDQIADAA